MKVRLRSLYVNFLLFKRAFRNYSFEKFNVAEIALFWTKGHLSRSQFLVLSGIMVGLTAGIAGVLLKTLVHWIQKFLSHGLQFEERIFFYAILPFIGIVGTALIIKYFFKGDEEKEMSFVLRQIAKNDGKLKSSKMYSSIIQSAVTVGFGGSAGLESPIALTGSAIGSNFAQRYRLGYKERILLLAAGAAAGIGSAFDAPIAGIMFAFEILLAGMVFTDFIPLVIAAISGSLVSNAILNEEAMFIFESREVFQSVNILLYVTLGILTGLYGRFFILTGQWVHKRFESLHNKTITRAVIGGVILSILCVAFPPLFGEGYFNVRQLHSGQIDDLIQGSLMRYFEPSTVMIVLFIGATIFLKAIATAVTIASGGNGGNFAPSLMSGGMIGYLFGFVLIALGFENVPLTNLMLVGMAGVVSGAMYAPLTAIFLIAESSSGYDLFIPLMTVSVIAYSVNRFFSPIHPSNKKLSEKGEIFTTRQDLNILSQLSLEACMNPTPLTVLITETLEGAIEKMKLSEENIMAVVDENNHLVGIISREQLRKVQNQQSARPPILLDCIIDPIFIISPDEQVYTISRKFDEADVWQLPVVNEDKEFVGFVSRIRILENYRKLLKQLSDA